MIDYSSTRTEHIRVVPDPYATHSRRSQPRHHAEGLKPSFSRTSSSGGTRPVGCPPTPRRSRTAPSQDHTRVRKDSEPWWHMAKTYAWVMEQEIAEMTRKNEEAVQWIRKQQERDRRERVMFPVVGGYYAMMMDELDEAEDRHRQKVKEEQTRRQAAHRGVDHAIQEEIHRLHSRRKHTERCRAAYSRRKTLEEEREREQRKQAANKARQAEYERSRWREYEERWNRITSGAGASELLAFENIPWPMLSSPRTIDDVRPAEVAMFLLSSEHSESQSMKDRVRSALRRWHPDRFGRLLSRVRSEDRRSVEEGAGVVARCLSNLLERAG